MKVDAKCRSESTLQVAASAPGKTRWLLPSVLSRNGTVQPFLVLAATISVNLQLHGVSLQIDTDGSIQHNNGCTVSLGIDTDGRNQNSYSSGIDTDGRSQTSYSEE